MKLSYVEEIEESGIMHEIWISEDGIKFCNLAGTNVLHRENGPAVIHPNGELEWWIDGSESALQSRFPFEEVGDYIEMKNSIVVSSEKVSYKNIEVLKVELYDVEEMEFYRLFLR